MRPPPLPPQPSSESPSRNYSGASTCPALPLHHSKPTTAKSRPDLPVLLLSQLPHSIQRWFQVERLDAHDPTTFTGLHRLRSALAPATDPTSRLAAATNAFASESISADALHQRDYGIPPS